MRTVLKYIVLVVVLSYTAQSCAAEKKTLPQPWESLEPIRTAAAEQENTGYVFLLAHKGEIILVDHMGLAIVEYDLPVERRSRFPIMSITKAFTGTALAIAVDEKLVDLDTPINAYLPDYTGANADTITLRHLASHVSGIPHTGHPQRKALYVEHFTSATDALSVVEPLEPASEPGEKYAYSSSGYNLIAAVIEARSKMAFTQFVETRIIAPLGMANTGFGDVLKAQPWLVRNYSYVDIWSYAPSEKLQQVPTWDFSYNMGGGNMNATADDLLKLGQALIDRNTFSPAVNEMLLTRSAGDASLSSWTLGWITGKDAWGRRTVHITGATPGVQAALYTYPDDEIVFAMLANCWGKGSAGGRLVTSAPQEIVDAFLRSLD